VNPLLVGCGIAAVLAGPPLYAQYASGGLDGPTAFLRWLIVALLCSVGAALIMNLIERYEKEWEEKDAQEAQAAAQAAAETEAKRAAEEAEAKRAAQNS
jgi:predicted lipid-binding transport protein (Tim44 family)